MDLGPYLLRLALLLPLICGFIIAALWVAKRLPGVTRSGGPTRSVHVVETLILAPGARLAVLDFGGRRLLVSVARGGVSLLGEAGPIPSAPAPQSEDA